MLTKSELLAFGLDYDETAKFCLVREAKCGTRKAVGQNKKGKVVVYTPKGYAPAAAIVWTLHNGDIPEDHAVVTVGDPLDCSLSNVRLVTSEEADQLRRDRRVSTAKALVRTPNGLPRGITQSGPNGYYTASFRRNGERFHKCGRDLAELTVWILLNRDGIDITMGGKL
ncbi:HNH endonuclease [Citrobacter sp. CK180]|uniref:HNH endonuclease n=1 Tax=Citrobacter sp. CK180 TaxID=2985089 RepID=UPI002578746C|nr:HNH endonuclease [Citrobacter sp. CK180]MDM3066126.1 HNH endonuclease [Citrobacter sp. CK180]